MRTQSYSSDKKYWNMISSILPMQVLTNMFFCAIGKTCLNLARPDVGPALHCFPCCYSVWAAIAVNGSAEKQQDNPIVGTHQADKLVVGVDEIAAGTGNEICAFSILRASIVRTPIKTAG
ncbi:MAG: hypothetical protein RQ867_07270 [Mariprofundaceae bacterium]|nr:hypothetical protein [Mariprofundaceae bacterium]